ncbi:MAG: BREX system ATP-binding domain-containing protein, partial [Methanomassiliicoccales archaeon]
MIFDKLLGWQKGEEYIRHMTLGAGIVEQKKSMGFRLQVHFPDGIVRKLRSDEVTYITKEEYDRSVTGMESRTPAGASSPTAATKPTAVSTNIGVDGRQYVETKQGPSKEMTVPAYAAIGLPREPATNVMIGKGARGREGPERRKQELSEACAVSHVQTGTIGPADPMNDRPAKTRPLPNITERDYHRSTKEFQARQVIESLRLGIPPQGVSEDFFEVFTVGRGDEIRRVEEFLEDDGEGSIIITGEYGSGKTHMMEITASIALREGWAVSMVELDTTEAPLSKPKSVYEKIAGSLRYMKDGRVQDFRNMLVDAAFSEKYESIMDHEYLNKIIQLIRDKEVTESHYVWIEGSGNRKYPFFDVYRRNDLDMNFALKLPQVQVIQSFGNIMVKGQTDEIADRLRKLGFLEVGSKIGGSRWILFDQDTERAYEDRNFPPMHYEMTSAAMLNGKPKIEAFGEGKLKFDTQRSVFASLDFDMRVTVRDSNRTE